MRIASSLNGYGHKVSKIVFDNEAVFVAMEERIGKHNMAASFTPLVNTTSLLSEPSKS